MTPPADPPVPREETELESLRARERWLTRVLDNLPDVIARFDRHCRHIYVNQAVEREFGTPPAALIGRTHREMGMAPELADWSEALIRRVFETGQEVTFDLRYPHRDGLRHYLAHGVPERDPDGMVESALFIHRNVTDRLRTEEALRQSERRFRALVEQGADAVTLLSRDGTVLYEGPTVQRITGLAPEERVGHSGLERVHPEDLARVRATIAGVMERPGAVARARFRSIRRDGSVWWTEGTATNLLDEPSVAAIVVNYHDVTDQVRAETERLELERRLLHAQKLESLGVLAGGIAHDFNNLLMAVLGSLELVAHDPTATPSVCAGIERAMQAARRAADLTRQMLAYSGKGRFVSVRVDLGELVRENAELLRASVGPQVTFELSPAGAPGVIEADPGQVQQVVMNLITNASEAIGPAGGTITLRTGMAECGEAELARSRVEVKPGPGRFAFVEVRDTGCGMDAATQERLFDPFFTTKFTGRGLGMSAVLGIVRAHAGAILLDSAPSLGTTIRVLFPLRDDTASHDVTPHVAPPDAEQATAPAGRLILVVDDEETVRRPCHAFVEALGYRGLEAADGRSALALFAERPGEITLVILDLTMPGLSGAEVLRELRQRRPGLPILVSSGFGEEAAREQLGGAASVGFIQKPYSLSELKEKLEQILSADPHA